jgi:UTP--glucose-1-phosphate uridylyltransferase
VVVGAHLLAGRPVTSEVATKEGDMGGAPARVDGRMMLLETMRFPPDFDHDSIPVFNTNSAMIDLDVLEQPYDLTWLYVEKDVDGRTALQLERLYHEITAFLPTTYLVVPRSGPRGRFFPIKTPADLEESRERLREMLGAAVTG